MKKLVFFIFAVCLFVSCAKNANELKVTVSNPSDFDRTTEIVEVDLSKIESGVKLAENQVYIVKNSKQEIVPSQITSDKKLIFQSGVKAGETAVFVVSAGEMQDFKAQTFGRFITERKDDFAWENDRVAFRIYGPALIATDGPSNGLDLWYKRTPDMIIDKWYKNDLAGVESYHDDHGEGLDDYKVGRTLGAGVMAPYADNKLWLNENFASQELIDNGPLRTTFKLTYKDINVAGKSFSESRTFSIDAGSQLTKVTQEYGTDSEIPVAAGIVKRPSGDSVIVSPNKDYIVYKEPKSEKAEGIYVALVFPQTFNNSVVDTYKLKNDKTKKEDAYSHVLAVTAYKPNTPIIYYTGYGWNKYGFSDEAEFVKYVENFVKSVNQPLTVEIK